MEFIVKFNDTNIETTKYKFMKAVKTFARFAREEQKNGNIKEANNMYTIACDYVWSAREFDLISLQTAFELIEQIAEYRYKN